MIDFLDQYRVPQKSSISQYSLHNPKNPETPNINTTNPGSPNSGTSNPGTLITGTLNANIPIPMTPNNNIPNSGTPNSKTCNLWNILHCPRKYQLKSHVSNPTDVLDQYKESLESSISHFSPHHNGKKDALLGKRNLNITTSPHLILVVM